MPRSPSKRIKEKEAAELKSKEITSVTPDLKNKILYLQGLI